MPNLKIQVTDITPESIEKLKAQNIIKAKLFFQRTPFATKLYLSMKSGLPLSFISENWKEITL